MYLHSTAPTVKTVFWVELDLTSCCFSEWLSLSQISGLTRDVARVSQFAGRKYFADLSFSFESGNFLHQTLFINSASCFSVARPDSSALEDLTRFPTTMRYCRCRFVRVEHVVHLWKFCRLQCHEGSEVQRSSHLHHHLNH